MQSTSIVICIAALAIVAVQYSEARSQPFFDLREEDSSSEFFIVKNFAERADASKIPAVYKTFFYQILI